MKPKITKNRTLFLSVILGIIYYVAVYCYTVFVCFSAGLHISVVIIASQPLRIVFCYVLPIVLILLPPAVLLFFRKTFMKSVLISFLVFVGCVAVFFSVSLVFTQYFKEFDAEKWKNHQLIRYLMIDDMESEHEFIGMTRDEVIGILGTPDDSFDDRLVYFIDTQSFMRIKYYVLTLEDDVVIEKTIVEVD